MEYKRETLLCVAKEGSMLSKLSIPRSVEEWRELEGNEVLMKGGEEVEKEEGGREGWEKRKGKEGGWNSER